MKLTVVLILLLCVLLSGCAQTTSENLTSTTVPQLQATTTMPSSSTKQVCDTPFPLPFLMTSSIDTYQDFVDQHDLPEHFVPYEKLSFIAPFSMIIIHKDPAEDGLQYYYYLLESKDGLIYGVDFTCLEMEDYIVGKTEFDLPLTGNLRTIDTEEEGYIRQNNAYWYYEKGKLDMIGIEFEQFVLHILPLGNTSYTDDTFNKVDHTHHEIMQNLLHADTAEAAVQAFMEAIGAPAK